MSTAPVGGDTVVGDCATVHGHVARICFKKGPPVGLGAELEVLVGHLDDHRRPVPLPALQELIARVELPGGSRVTFEPGGQLELSSRVFGSLDSCVSALGQDLSRVTGRLQSEGYVPLPCAAEPVRPPRRQLHTKRYDAMEAYFRALGPRQGDIARTMMTATAAVQVNVDCGVDEVQIGRRWQLLRLLGPVLVAAFANSPRLHGRPTGWKSARARVWQQLDPSRTAWPAAAADPVTAYAEFVLDAPVMVLRSGEHWAAAPGFTFRQWVEGIPGQPPPEQADLDYHLTTLFPPVRARGWFEVRYLDAQPPGLWPVPVAVLWSLLHDPLATDAAAEAAEPVAATWADAARSGLADPQLARAARQCFEAALRGLSRLGCSAALCELVARFAETYVDRARCPADDPVHHPSTHHPPTGQTAPVPPQGSR